LLTSLPLVAGFAVSVFVGLMFLVAAIDKLRHRDLLPGVIANYRLLPERLVAPAAAVLPLAELLVAVGLLMALRPWAPMAAAALLLVFAAAMAINIRRGRRHIDCGCGHAALRQALGWTMVLRNVGLSMALLLWVVLPGSLATAEIVVAVVAGGVAFLMLQMFNALRALGNQTVRAGGAKG